MHAFRMRIFRQACILCRHTQYSTPPLFAAQRAEFSQSQRALKGYLTFDASQLVLDLDASDCKYVRLYEESHDESGDTIESRPGVMRPLRIRDVDRATGADYLYLAISNGSALSSPIIRKVLERNRISTRHGSFDFTVQLLKDNAMLAREPNLALDKYGPPYREKYHLRLLDCATLDELRRTTHRIATTSEGCRFLSDNGSVVVDAIRSCRIRTKVPVAKVVRFINALSQRLGSHEVNIGEPLCDAGIYYATKSLSLQALKKYLEVAVASNCFPVTSKHRKNALSIIAKRYQYLRSRDFHSKTFWSKARLKQYILELLTGFDGDEVPGSGAYRKPSFASLIRDSDDMYFRYITSLGYLGASEVLWSEWMNPGLTPIPQSLDQAGEGNNRADVFIIAFLVADDFERASLVMESIKHMGRERARAREFLLDHYGQVGGIKVFSHRFRGQLASIAKM